MFFKNKSYVNASLRTYNKYFARLTMSVHDQQSLFGFCILLTVFMQLFTGTVLAFSLIPEPMIIPLVRDEEDLEDLYTDDFFWLHERGVDFLFILSWSHLFRKLYIGAYDYEHEVAWKTGVYTFLVLQAVTFLGLVLCCSHLSEITLTIASNIIHTAFAFKGKVYWLIFTDKTLNSDTLVRLAFAHYLSAFFMAYMGVLHSFDMHYDWKTEFKDNGLDSELLWWEEGFLNELALYIDLLAFFFILGIFLYNEPETLSYEIFMWGDVGMMPDIRFYGVAPHWYFRPFMAWLIACPHHKTGIFGLIFFFFILYHQPTLHGSTEENDRYKRNMILGCYTLNKKFFFKNFFILVENNFIYQITFAWFFVSCLYCSSFLPYGRFYNRVGGNKMMLFSFFYIFFYLTFPSFRKNLLIELFIIKLDNMSKFLSKTKKTPYNCKRYSKKHMRFFYKTKIKK